MLGTAECLSQAWDGHEHVPHSFPCRKHNSWRTSCCDGTEGAPPKVRSPSVTKHNRAIRQTLSWRIQDAFVDNFHSSVLLRDFLRLQDSLAHLHLTFSPSPSLQSDLHSNLMTPAFPGPLPISFEAGIATSHVSYHRGVCFSEAPYLYDGL